KLMSVAKAELQLSQVEDFLLSEATRLPTESIFVEAIQAFKQSHRSTGRECLNPQSAKAYLSQLNQKLDKKTSDRKSTAGGEMSEPLHPYRDTPVNLLNESCLSMLEQAVTQCKK